MRRLGFPYYHLVRQALCSSTVAYRDRISALGVPDAGDIIRWAVSIYDRPQIVT